MTDKMTLKTTKRIINIMREKRVCRFHSPSSIMCCPEVQWSLLGETVAIGFASSGESLDKHSYAALKLGRTAPNILVCFSVAVIKMLSKSKQGRKGFIWLTCYSPQLPRKAKAGTQDRNLEEGTEAEITEEHCLVACF